MITMGVKSLNKITWLLTSESDVYDLWNKIKQAWLGGSLSGRDGEEIGKKRSDLSSTVNMLKGFKGIVEKEVFKSLLQKVLNKECVLAQDNKF
jgi:hypothetical protein